LYAFDGRAAAAYAVDTGAASCGCCVCWDAEAIAADAVRIGASAVVARDAAVYAVSARATAVGTWDDAVDYGHAGTAAVNARVERAAAVKAVRARIAGEYAVSTGSAAVVIWALQMSLCLLWV
jgi:hypothetical protein